MQNTLTARSNQKIILALLEAAFTLLHDGCPKSPCHHLCDECDEYDETACERCWTECLFDIANGKVKM